MVNFDLSFEYMILNEGGWAPNDTGGPTNWGLLQEDLAEFYNCPLSAVSVEQLKNLTKDMAKPIYQKLYWDKMTLFGLLEQGVATCILDTAVNRGCGCAGMYAQKVCNLLGVSVVCDGDLGPVSIAALNRLPLGLFIDRFEALEMAGYEAILAHNRAMEVNRHGWEKRARRLLTLRG